MQTNAYVYKYLNTYLVLPVERNITLINHNQSRNHNDSSVAMFLAPSSNSAGKYIIGFRNYCSICDTCDK